MKKTIKFADKEIDISPGFRFYITTKLNNPHYAPEVSTKTCVVNFAVTSKGLQDQLLAVVVNREEPRLEEERSRLVNVISDGRRKLIELEDQILSLLRSASGSLLDDEVLINTLNVSKTTSEDVKAQLVISEETSKKIDRSREIYRPVSVRSAILFFVLTDLSVYIFLILFLIN